MKTKIFILIMMGMETVSKLNKAVAVRTRLRQRTGFDILENAMDRDVDGYKEAIYSELHV